MTTSAAPDTSCRTVPHTSFFSSDPFFEAIAKAFYPGRPWQAEYVAAGGKLYRVLVVGRTIVDQLWAQPFFYEPLEGAQTPASRHLSYLPRVAQGHIPYETVAAEGFPGGVLPAPFIDWTGFASWDDYVQGVLRLRPLALLQRTTQRRRSVRRRIGELEFRPRDDDPAALDLAMRWKSTQLRATGLPDWFADPRTRLLYEEFAGMGLLTISTLRAGPSVMAALAGMLWDGRYYGRLGCYDSTFATDSPGRLLYFDFLEWCYRQGHREFDFLMGGEEYKWGFATHARLIAPVGQPPARRLIAEKARAFTGTQLLRWPGIGATVRNAERWLRGWSNGD
jgi:hypothetical protein